MRLAIEGDLRAAKLVDDAHRRADAEVKARAVTSPRAQKLSEDVIRLTNRFAQLAARGELRLERDLSEATGLEEPGGDPCGSRDPECRADDEKGADGLCREAARPPVMHEEDCAPAPEVSPVETVVGQDPDPVAAPAAAPRQTSGARSGGWSTTGRRGPNEPLIAPPPLTVDARYYGGAVIPRSDGR